MGALGGDSYRLSCARMRWAISSWNSEQATQTSAITRALLPRDGDHVAARLGRDRDVVALERLCFGERGGVADPFPAAAGDAPQAASGRAPYVVGGFIYHDDGTASTGLSA